MLYKSALPEEKRDLLRIVTSNRRVSEKSVDITLAEPFDQIANRNKITYGAPYRDVPRTLDALLNSLTAWFKANPTVSFEITSTLSDKRTSGEIGFKKGILAA